MANEIKLKRGSGSDPTASDLVVGELAIRTDNGKIFTKKDNGSVAEISGGGGIDDGDKGDITVSNSGATFTIDNDAVTYAKIQNVSATNRILGRDSSGAGVIEEITPANLRTMLNVADGATNVTNTNQLTNGAGYITATLTNEQVQDIVGGMVSGNTESGITVTYQDSDGTLDFSVASQTDNNFTNADHSKLDGIEAGATADQTASEIVALIADQTIAPSTIDMEDDEEIRLGNSDDLKIFHNGSHSRFLDNGAGKLQFGSDTGFEILTANFATQIALFDTSQILLKENTSVTGNISVSGTVDGRDVASDGSKLDGIESGATADQSASEILTLLKTVDGSGSGLDADTLDGVSSGSFLRSDTGDSASGDIAFQGGAGAVTISANSDIRLENGNWTGDALGKIQHHSNYLYIGGGSSGIIFRESGTNRWIIDGSGHLAVGADSTYDIGTSGTRVRNGYFDTLYGDGSNLTGISAGATGGGSDEIFYENGQTVTTNYTITNGKNAMSAGPITVNSGVTVTVGAGETLTIV